MSCCDETTARVPDTDVSRRVAVQGRGRDCKRHPGARAKRADAQGKRSSSPIAASFCAACPTRSRARPATSRITGLMCELVYTRGGNAAMQALVGGAVDYAATSLDVASRLMPMSAPTSAALRSPGVFRCLRCHRSQDRRPDSIDQGSGRKDGRRFRARQCRSCARALSAEAGRRRCQKVKFATMGINLLEALRQGQIDVGLVQEPALTLLQRSGARVLVNAMDLEDAKPLSRRFL